jgi:hypothetical protein
LLQVNFFFSHQAESFEIDGRFERERGKIVARFSVGIWGEKEQVGEDVDEIPLSPGL